MAVTERDMQVYIEAAFLENFLLDGAICYLALVCARLKISVWRLLLAGTAGAAVAIVFPLFTLPVWAAYLVKFACGVAIVLIAARGRPKQVAVAAALFFAFTFALGGLLTAVYSFCGVGYEAGTGYIVEQAPVGLVFGGAAAFAIAAAEGARFLYRYRKQQQNTLPCVVAVKDREVRWKGYADSGNNLFFRGNPVCVTSAVALLALFGREEMHEAGRMTVSTVNGGREAPVFTCDRMDIEAGGETFSRQNVYLTVGEVTGEYQLILNTALMEA